MGLSQSLDPSATIKCPVDGFIRFGYTCKIYVGKQEISKILDLCDAEPGDLVPGRRVAFARD